MTNKWVFADDPNVMVLTTKRIVLDKFPITYVSHDADDGMWQFHDGTELDEESAMLLSLNEIVEIDPTIKLLAELPIGWIAWRIGLNDEWKTEIAV